MHRFNRAAVMTTMALALPGCGELGIESSPPPDRTKVVFDGPPIAAKEITSADCEGIAAVHYPSPPKKDTAKAQREYQVRLSMARYDEVERAALNNDLPKAKAIAGSLARQAVNGSFAESIVVKEDAEAFIAAPADRQLMLKAECAVLAGEIGTAEAMIKRIGSGQRAVAEDEVEFWQGYLAAETAKDDENFKDAYRLLGLIDDQGDTTRVSAQDEVEFWVGYHAETLAQDDAAGAKRALKLIDKHVDDSGDQTRANVRDETEFWVEYHAKNLALEGQVARAAELAASVDNAGDYTLESVQQEVDRIIAG